MAKIPPPPKEFLNEKNVAQLIDYDAEIKKLKKAKEESFKVDKEQVKNLKRSIDSKELMDLKDIKVYLQESRSKFGLGGKCDGYILYRKQNRRWRFIKVVNFRDVYKIIHAKYAYIIDNVVGVFDDGKPFFIIDEKIPITLNLSARSSIVDDDGEALFDGKDLCYDAKGFYVYLDTITLKNLTPKELNSGSGDFMKFLADWWWAILIVLLLVLFFTLTPIGKDMLLKIMPMIAEQQTNQGGGLVRTI